MVWYVIIIVNIIIIIKLTETEMLESGHCKSCGSIATVIIEIKLILIATDCMKSTIHTNLHYTLAGVVVPLL